MYGAVSGVGYGRSVCPNHICCRSGTTHHNCCPGESGLPSNVHTLHKRCRYCCLVSHFRSPNHRLLPGFPRLREILLLIKHWSIASLLHCKSRSVRHGCLHKAVYIAWRPILHEFSQCRAFYGDCRFQFVIFSHFRWWKSAPCQWFLWWFPKQAKGVIHFQ